MSIENEDKIVEETKETEQQAAETQAAPEVKAEVVKENSDDDKNDAIVKKVIFSLCYLWGILFFLPLIMYKGDSTATKHANNGLVLLLVSVIGNIILGGLSALTSVFGILAGVFSLLMLVFGILGIVYVVTDQDKDLPLISKIKILK